MLTLSRHGLDGLFPFLTPRQGGARTPGLPFNPSLPSTAVITDVLPFNPSQHEGIRPQEGRPAIRAQEGPAPDAATPTATVTPPAAASAPTMPEPAPTPDVVAAAPKRWPWVVGGIAAASALILGTRLLRR